MPDLTDPRLFLFALLVGGHMLGAVVPLLLTISRNQKHSVHQQRARAAKNLGFAAAFAASLAGFALSLSVLVSGQPFHLDLHSTLPFGTMALHVDGLSAWFLAAICLLAAPVSVYSLGYATEYLQRRNMGVLLCLYNAFLLSMIVVVIAAHAVLFLFVWEVMSLTTFFLITYEHEEAASRRAGLLYVIMTHIGTAFLMVMFLLLYAWTGSFGFEDFRNAAAGLPATVRSLVFLCALVGFGTKAGVIPLHIWLPEAHPAAPSNVSALMSGVMIKTGIYGIVRVAFDLAGREIPAWWGMLVLGLAVVSAVLGVLYALLEHDVKRLLAFHSIENIGIILMGVGGGLLFASLGNRLLGALALIAALYHVVNHAMFKGLLFLGAGSVLRATGTRNIEELGGLVRTLPWTSFFFLVGAVAISALPPLNGFVSEWLTFQALLLGFQVPGLAVKIAIPLTVALLALTGALAAACFVKAFGITFLGLPRSPRAGQAQESPVSMLLPMGFLALLCVVLGVAPGPVLAVLDPLAGSLVGAPAGVRAVTGNALFIAPAGITATISPPILALVLAAATLLPLLAGVRIARRLRRRTAMTWACGLEKLEPRMQYTATGFSKPIRMIFSNIFRARHEIEISEDASPYFHPQIRYELRTESVFQTYLYDPLRRGVITAARMARRIQTGHIQSYLAYIFIVLVLLLLFAR